MKIDPSVQRTKAQDPNKKTELEPGKETTTSKTPGSSTLKTDKVTISEQARSLQRAESELKILKKDLDAQTPVREDKVELARSKLASGNLITDEVVESTAEAILKSGTLSDLINIDQPLIKAMLAETGDLEASEEKLAEIKERIQSGYYNSPEVVGDIADKMLEDLLG
jgi:anti-sigma28 factor (negative regulator of flagellin synthesis)